MNVNVPNSPSCSLTVHSGGLPQLSVMLLISESESVSTMLEEDRRCA